MIGARSRESLAVLLGAVGLAARRSRLPVARTEPLRRTRLGAGPAKADIGYLLAACPHGPRVLLVHGCPGSAEAWTDYLLAPPPGAEMLALDRPGFGRSGPAGAVTDLAGQAAAVAALLPGDGRPAVLVGHSLGGAIAARVAAEHPQRIGALVLIAASLDPQLESVHPLQRVAAWPLLRALLPRVWRNANAELLALRGQLAELAGLLGRITAPVIIVHGSVDALVPVGNVRYVQSQLSATRCLKTQLLAGHSHFLPWRAESSVRQAIDWALARSC